LVLDIAEALFIAEHEFSVRDGSIKSWMPSPTGSQMKMFSKLKRVTYEGHPNLVQQASERGTTPATTSMNEDDDDECVDEEGTFSPMSFRGRLFSTDSKR
jgi:hypothetical protein